MVPGPHVMHVANEAVEITQISFVLGGHYAVDSSLIVLFHTKWTLGHQLIASIRVLPSVLRFKG